MRIPAGAQVVLLGGGRGYLGYLLRNRGRTLLNIDLAVPKDVFVPTIQGDMEESIPLIRSKFGSEPLRIIAPLSLEYTDSVCSTENLARVLSPNDVLVWICHCADSSIIRDLQKARPLLAAVSYALEQAKELPMPFWLPIARRLESRANEIFGYNSPSLFDLIPEELKAKIKLLTSQNGDCFTNALNIAALLGTSQYQTMFSEKQLLIHAEARREMLELSIELVRPVLDNPVYTHKDLQPRILPGFRFVDSKTFSSGEPDPTIVICAFFERK